MLQRAASNAYSWWWASHVRTKQSKWLEQNLQDLEEKVGYTLKLIEEDGDSFAKRAEMYYKKRPELISFVEEAYRAYRALAERYDHISTELQNANNTIAAVFPEKVQFMEEDDEDTSPRVKKRSDIQKGNIPSVPKAPTKDLKNVITTATKKLRTSRSRKAAATVAKSGLSKAEGLEEIGKLQKNILALQTQKEFVKSSYEDKLAKYWDIDNQIREMQGRIYTLQDDFGAGIVIEDDDARSLMASTALKSCEETLTQLQEKHGRSAGEAKAEHKSIKNSQEKSESIKDEFLDNETSQKRPYAKDDSVKAVDGSTTEGGEESEASQEKIKEDFEVGSNDSLTVSEMAEKIDELVNKVLSLDTAFLSQTSFLQRLQTENDKLQRQIPVLEDEKAMLINSKNELSNKLVMMEETLHRLQCLNSNVNDHNNNFQTFSCEAHSPPLNAEKLRSLKPDKELQHSSQKEDKSSDQGKLQEVDGQEGVLNPNDGPNRLQTEKLPEEKLEQTMNVPKEKPGEELQNSSQKDDRSAVQGKVQEVDGQEGSLNHDDGPNRPQTVKLLVEKPDEELQHVSQKEDKSTIQGKLQKVDGQEGATDANDRSYKLPTVKLPEEKPDEELQYSSQKEDKFTVQVKLQEVDGQEGVLNPNDGANGLQNVTLPEEKSDEKLQHSSQKEDKSTVQGKLQEVDEQEGALKPNDGPNILELVKLSMEKSNEELQHSSQKEDESTIQDNLHQIDRQGVAVNPNDGPNVLQNVKIPRKVEVKHSSENNKTPQKEEMSAVQVNSQKEIDEQKGEMDSNHGLQRRQSLKLPEEHEIQSSSKQEETSAVKDRSQKRFEGSECAPNLADDKQHRAKPNEELKVSSSIQKEEKAIDAETEVANHTKEHDLYTMPGNEGEVFSPSQSNVEPSNILEKIPDQMTQQKVDNQASSQAPNNSPNFEREEQLTEQGHEPDREKKLNVMENREKALLTEYMKILQNYTELKKKLDEEGIQTSEDKETAENNSEITVQLEEMRSDNARKDEEIRVLREKLSILQAGTDGNNKLDNQWAEQKVTVIETPRTQPSEEEQDIKVIPLEQSQTTSAIEEKFRISIDELLEENLDFWLRFSGTFHQIQKFETEVKDLEAEVSKVQDKKKHSESSSIKYSLKSDIRPLYNHLREIQTELTLWMEKSALLKEELTARFSSLCDIQEEITRALRLSAEDYDFKFTSFQAAKFQGEVLNMKQENNKVADELQAGLDHVTTLQIDLEKTLTSLSEEFGFSDAKSGPNIKLERSDSRNRVPLRSFIFGVKPKKPKSSFLSSMHPALARKYNGFRSGLNR